MTANVAVRVIDAVAAVLVARALGPANRGVLAAALLWPTLVLSGGSLVGLSTVAYFGARGGTRALRTCFEMAVALALLLTAISLTINWALLAQRNPAAYAHANWYTLVIPLAVVGNVFAGALVADGRVEALWVTRIAGAVARTAPMVALAVVGALTARWYVWLSVAGVAATALGAAALRSGVFARRVEEPLSEPTEGRDILAFGARTMLTVMPAQLHQRIDQLMMSVALPAVVLGQYTVAFTWSSAVHVIGAGMAVVVLSLSVRTNVADPKSIHMATARVRRASALAIATAVLAAVSAPLGIPLVFGGQFADAVVPAVLLSLAAGLVSWKSFLHEFARALGQPSLGRLPEVLGLGASAVALAVLLPALGGFGAAMAAILSYMVVVVSLIHRIQDSTPHLARGALWPRADDVWDVGKSAVSFLRHPRGWRRQRQRDVEAQGSV